MRHTFLHSIDFLLFLVDNQLHTQQSPTNSLVEVGRRPRRRRVLAVDFLCGPWFCNRNPNLYFLLLLSGKKYLLSFYLLPI